MTAESPRHFPQRSVHRLISESVPASIALVAAVFSGDSSIAPVYLQNNDYTVHPAEAPRLLQQEIPVEIEVYAPSTNLTEEISPQPLRLAIVPN